jgi:hypothetical protein
VKAYKFLSAGRVGLFSNFEWPPAGEWVETKEPLVDCLHGVHAVRFEHLLDWIDDELWEVELGGSIAEREEMLVAERGRLTRRLEHWDAAAASAFAEACALRTAGLAADVLRRDGRPEEAANVAAAEELGAAQEAAVAALVTTSDPAVAEVVGFAADLVSLVGGSRPESWRPPVVASPAVQSAAAVAANAAFASAHAAGRAAARSADEGSYAAGFAAERAWQLDRLRDVVGG